MLSVLRIIKIDSILQVRYLNFQVCYIKFFASFQVTTFSCSKVKDDKEDGFFYFRYSSIYFIITDAEYCTKYSFSFYNNLLKN